MGPPPEPRPIINVWINQSTLSAPEDHLQTKSTVNCTVVLDMICSCSSFDEDVGCAWGARKLVVGWWGGRIRLFQSCYSLKTTLSRPSFFITALFT